jgi:hypothetical protein
MREPEEPLPIRTGSIRNDPEGLELIASELVTNLPLCGV